MEGLTYTKTYEQIEGYAYPQPVERVNGLTYPEFTKGDKNKERQFAELYWAYVDDKRIRDIARFDSPYYSNIDKEYVYNTIKGYKHTISVTALFDFELYLLSTGWRFASMGGVNTESGRVYENNGKEIGIYFGLELGGEYMKFAVIASHSVRHLPTKDFNEFINRIWQV